MRLLFYGGVNEIGGNKVIVEDRNTKILLDFGMSFSERKRFYIEPWLSPRDEEGLLEFGILPSLKGVYRSDNAHPSIDAVFISHSHADHASCIPFLNRTIPVHCGKAAEVIIKSLGETRPKSFETDYTGLRLHGFKTGDIIKVGNIEVEPIHVDHSIPGAYGLIIHTSEGAIVYTGDFRVHGSRADLTWDFIKKAEDAEPIALICEGTNIGGADVSSESEVKSKVGKVVQGTDKLVLADFSYADVDRFRTFYEAAVKNDRKLAISMKQAFIFDKLKHNLKIDLPEIDEKNLVIFQKGKKRYYRWEEEVLSHLNVKNSKEIRNIQDHVIMVCSLFDLKELIEIKPRAGSSFIHSASEPVDEEGALEFDRLLNWLDHFGLPLYQIHCSGHIMPNELKDVVSRIKPKKVYPIHTEHPHLFAKFISAYAEVEAPKLTK